MSVTSVPFLPRKDLISLSSYQLREGIFSPPTSGCPHMILEKALKLCRGTEERFSGDSSRSSALSSTKLERDESWGGGKEQTREGQRRMWRTQETKEVCVCVSGREAKRDVGKDKLIQRERDREIDERDKRKWR